MPIIWFLALNATLRICWCHQFFHFAAHIFSEQKAECGGKAFYDEHASAHTRRKKTETKKRRAASKDLMRKVTGETENKTQGHCLEKHGKHVAFGRACLLGISCTWGGARVLTLLSTPLKPTQYRVPYCRPIPRLFALPCVWSLSLMPCVSTHPASFRGSSARLCSALGISFLFPCNVNFAHPYGWNTT